MKRMSFAFATLALLGAPLLCALGSPMKATELPALMRAAPPLV